MRSLFTTLILGLCFGAWGCKDKTVTPTLSRDLMVTASSPFLASSTVSPGGNVDIPSVWTVKNQGTASTGDFTNGYYLSTDAVITSADTYLGGTSDAGLAAGDSYAWAGPTSVTIPGGTTPGAYYFGILVDRDNVVRETNEANNYVSTPITVGASLPDLNVESGSPTVTPSTVLPGGMVTLSDWNAQNQGSAPSGLFANGFYLSTDATITAADVYLGGNSNTLNPGDIHIWGGPTLTIPIGTAPGAYYVGILMDPSNAVTESDESNNYASTAITVSGPLADLNVQSGSPTATPSTVVPGGTVTLSSWNAQNQGAGPSGLFSNGFYLSTDSTITSADVYLDGNSNTLNPGDIYIWGAPTLTIPIGTTPGTYYIGILMDPSNAVAESDESNNYASTAITVVAPLPDLYISSGAPTPTPTSIRPGGTMTLTGWTVQNRGTAAAGLFSNGFYLSTDATITAADTYIDGNANALAAGASFAWGGPTLIIPIGTTPGSYYIGILVDSGGGITESDETNNYVSTAITVIPGP